jgi:peptidyl-tRNA hydrolase, PTH1 family
MKLVIGLGNPGPQYEQTRHNAGFRIADLLATKYGWKWERQGRAMLASGNIGTEKVVLVKPLTFMNKSGEAVGELIRWHKLQPEDVLVVYDDLDLAVSKLRLRANGSAGGHNGVDSIIHHLHTNQFPRLRVGIGRPANSRMDTIHYVLGTPPGDERILLSTGEEKAVEAILLTIQQGVAPAMNLINVDPEAQRKAEEKRRLQQERREQERLRKEAEQYELKEAVESSDSHNETHK